MHCNTIRLLFVLFGLQPISTGGYGWLNVIVCARDLIYLLWFGLIFFWLKICLIPSLQLFADTHNRNENEFGAPRPIDIHN